MTKEKREVDELGNITHYDENGAFKGIEVKSSLVCLSLHADMVDYLNSISSECEKIIIEKHTPEERRGYNEPVSRKDVIIEMINICKNQFQSGTNDQGYKELIENLTNEEYEKK